jgi:hypothetical protein
LTNAPHPPPKLRGSIHTVSLKCAQSCLRGVQIARGAVAPVTNRRHYGLDTWIAPIGLASHSEVMGRSCRSPILTRRHLTRAGTRNIFAEEALRRSDTKRQRERAKPGARKRSVQHNGAPCARRGILENHGIENHGELRLRRNGSVKQRLMTDGPCRLATCPRQQDNQNDDWRKE